MDGAIDETYQFGRQTFVQLSSAKIEVTDALESEVPNVETYVAQALAHFSSTMGQPLSNLVTDKNTANRI